MMPWNGLHRPYQDSREATEAIVASASILDVDNTRSLVIPPLEWQRESWAFFHTLGELQFAVGTWLSNAASKVRLIAAVKRLGEDTPSPVMDGPVAEIVANFAGGIDGQAAVLKRQVIHMCIPGDSYLVGEDPSGFGRLELMEWAVYSSDEIRIKRRQTKSLKGEGSVTFEINTYRNEWRQLADESMVIRCWEPDPQFSWAAVSPCQAALPILREVDFYNRYIIAVLLSRLANNGMLLIPAEVTFPAKPQYKDAPDPFVAELIDIASRSIKNPGSASAAVPMPLKVPAQYIEMFKHLTFDTQMGKEVMENRSRALERLAVAINVPTELMMPTGMKNMNHWGAWQLEESAVKMYITPPVELLASCYTRGFLYPVLDSLGLPRTAPDGGKYIIWYDASELVQQPDRTNEAQAIYDRGELGGHALRRESGFEEDDAPSDDEFKTIALKKIALGAGPDAMQALAALTGDSSLLPPAPPPTPAAEGEPTGGGISESPSRSEGEPPAAGQTPSGVEKAPPDTRNARPQPPSAPQRQTLGVPVLDEMLENLGV